MKLYQFYMYINLCIGLWINKLCGKFHSFTAKEFEKIDRNQTYTSDKRDRNKRGDTKLSPSGFFGSQTSPAWRRFSSTPGHMWSDLMREGSKEYWKNQEEFSQIK